MLVPFFKMTMSCANDGMAKAAANASESSIFPIKKFLVGVFFNLLNCKKKTNICKLHKRVAALPCYATL